MYKVKVRQDGTRMFYKDGRLVKKSSIPETIVATLEANLAEDKPAAKTNLKDFARMGGDIDVEDESSDAFRPPLPTPQAPVQAAQVEPTPESPAQTDLPETCVFCGQPKERTRFLNLQLIPLCEEHYSSQTTGEIAAQMRALHEVGSAPN